MAPQPPPGVEPVVRMASRVVLLDEQDRVLLFCWEDDRIDAKRVWITPGGGLNPGEAAEAGARRELFEETGIDSEPGPCVWKRTHVFRFGEGWIEQRELFYLVRWPLVEVRLDGLELHERVAMTAHRLWSVDEIATSDERFAPRGIAKLLPSLIRGDVPTEPIEIGV